MRDEPMEHGSGLGGFRRYTWWSLTGTLVFFLVLSVGGRIPDPDVPGWARALSAVALVVLIAAIVVLLRRRLSLVPEGVQAVRPPVGWLAAGCAAAGVLGAIAPVIHGQRLWSLAPAMMVSVAATFLPPPKRRMLVAAAVVAAAVLGGVVGFVSGGAQWPSAVAEPVGLVAFTSWTTLGMLWGWDVAERLNAAGRLAAELAVKEERLRFASDLHDIQGHHLQVIALKSELAARLVEADPSRAAAEMREVQQLSTDALRDTRAVAQGYRRTTLEEEIANAAKVLASAEIRTSVDRDSGTDVRNLSETGRHLLGLVMREATTNVLRHSRAGRARIAYRVEDGRALLRVGNDGATGSASQRTGTGLPVLAERLRNAEGTLEWRNEDGWFEVVASLPTGTAGAK
ncbi:sensor histidine kinase [Actinocorallia aurantiaca]|uniref:Signal transduction histidine kinase subgroup 3 dimerisation and phosphoacceptor domain-containing protein n=1 Tax=Actinocorallia aurantiaca TaxID=46204 RepID=A0ABN3U535_9ACTN